MEVDADSYPHHLLGLLINISEADFVSFDLELTGIPSHLPGRTPWAPQAAGGRKTLEDRYQETKTAADRYQILQVGITCVRFDYITSKYILRPYNITLSPLLNEQRLDIEREIHIQTGAATFLLNNGFDMGAPFARGVQYLSREEADRAKQRAYDRVDKKLVVEDMQLKEKDVQSLDFVRRTREAINAWKTDLKSVAILEITTHTGLAEQPLIPAISRFEKRLVHQLVRAEFPNFVTISRQECIRIVPFNALREEENNRRVKSRVKEQIAKQTGFRWVFEALAGGDIHEADPFHFGGANIIAADCPDVKDRFDRAQERLRTHQPVLVGHNMFTDIVYFYRTFVGELPETLDGFCEAVHELFPRIVDTKYLATHAEGDLNASPTLQEIAEKYEKQPLPDIVTHADHSKYHDKVAFHEAGYDSLLTATILLRLSARIGAERQQEQERQQRDSDSDASFKTATEEPTVTANGHDHFHAKPQGGIALPPTEHLQPPMRERQQTKPKKGKSKNKNKSRNSKAATPAERRFQTRNIFDSLRELSLNPEPEQETPFSSEDVQAAPPWKDEAYVPDTTGWAPLETKQRAPMELVPAFDSDFWATFGNTLRVYGTQEAVLKIADWVP